MNADGSGQTRLTNTPGVEFYPSWSPSGNRIAFSSNRAGNFDIYVMKRDGKAQTQLTTGPGWDTDPKWGQIKE